MYFYLAALSPPCLQFRNSQIISENRSNWPGSAHRSPKYLIKTEFSYINFYNSYRTEAKDARDLKGEAAV